MAVARSDPASCPASAAAIPTATDAAAPSAPDSCAATVPDTTTSTEADAASEPVSCAVRVPVISPAPPTSPFSAQSCNAVRSVLSGRAVSVERRANRIGVILAALRDCRFAASVMRSKSGAVPVPLPEVVAPSTPIRYSVPEKPISSVNHWSRGNVGLRRNPNPSRITPISVPVMNVLIAPGLPSPAKSLEH